MRFNSWLLILTRSDGHRSDALKKSRKSVEKHPKPSNRISWHVDCCDARSEGFHVNNHREVHDEMEFRSALNRRSVSMVIVRVRCEPCCPDRQGKTVSLHPDGWGNKRTSERTSRSSCECTNSLQRRWNEKDRSALYNQESAGSRSDKWDSVYHYRSGCIGDHRADISALVGVLVPSHSAATVGQEHTLVSPRHNRGGEYRDELAAPLPIGSLMRTFTFELNLF
jgi:hypothetical protein